MNEKLQARVAALKEKGVTPKLAIVRCGENPSDLSYEKGATEQRGADRRRGREVRSARGRYRRKTLIAQIEAINADRLHPWLPDVPSAARST